jgi:hypothetical protein
VMIQDSILVCSPDPRIPHTAAAEMQAMGKKCSTLFFLLCIPSPLLVVIAYRVAVMVVFFVAVLYMMGLICLSCTS